MPLVFARDRTSGVLRCFFVAVLVALALLMRFSPPVEAHPVARAAGGGCNAHKSHLGVKRFAHAVLCVQNRHRKAYGLRRLRASRSLRRAAVNHARDMVRRGYFGHVSFGGGTVVDRVGRTGYSRRFTAGENIFYGLPPRPSPAAVVAAWMDSPGHRHQILNPAWEEVGIGTIMRPPVADSGRRHRSSGLRESRRTPLSAGRTFDDSRRAVTTSR